MKHIIIRTQDAFTGQSNLNDDIHHFEDGRWSMQTRRAKMLQAVRDANLSRNSKGLRPLRATGYEVLGKSDPKLYEMPYVPAHSLSWEDQETGALCVYHRSGSGANLFADITVYDKTGRRRGTIFTIKKNDSGLVGRDSEPWRDAFLCEYKTRNGVRRVRAGAWRNTVFVEVVADLVNEK